MNSTRRTPPALPHNPIVYEKRVFPEIKLQTVLEMISKQCAKSTVERFGTCKNYEQGAADVVIFLPRATSEFYNMVYWNERHPINVLEQLYQGMGHVFMDGKRRIIIISHFLYVYAANRTSVSAGVLGDKVDSMMDRLEYERSIYVSNEKKCNKKKDGTVYDPFIDYGPSEAVLWGHTHPNLGVFFSPPDRVSGFATPDFPAVTFVADPIRKEMKAGVGIELSDAAILAYSEAKPLNNSPVITAKEKPLDVLTVKSTKDERKELLCQLSQNANVLLTPTYGATGKYQSYTTIKGIQKVELKLTIKPEKNATKNEQKKATKKQGYIGTSLDMYA